MAILPCTGHNRCGSSQCASATLSGTESPASRPRKVSAEIATASFPKKFRSCHAGNGRSASYHAGNTSARDRQTGATAHPRTRSKASGLRAPHSIWRPLDFGPPTNPASFGCRVQSARVLIASARMNGAAGGQKPRSAGPARFCHELRQNRTPKKERRRHEPGFARRHRQTEIPTSRTGNGGMLHYVSFAELRPIRSGDRI